MSWAAPTTETAEYKSGLQLLYISYWGIREPLGQALMVPPLLRFAATGLQITVVSFEKPHHLADRSGMEESRRQLSNASIQWMPLRYHRRPTAPATAWDIVYGGVRSVLASLPRRPDVVHGRTYIGGLIGYQVSRALKRPFVFHNEGFWPDEQVDSGIWSARGRCYRMTKRWERSMYQRADAVITLAQPAQEIVAGMRRDRPTDSTVVVSSCVDLDRFQLRVGREKRAGCRMIYTGSLGRRYLIPEMARFVKAVRQEIPDASLTIYSHSDSAMIRDIMREQSLKDDAWSLDFVPHARMPEEMVSYDAGLFFLIQGISTQVCSPTKIGEYWACGLPVVTTPEVGDVDDIVRRERVGVVVEADTDGARQEAVQQLQELLKDPELSHRCRRAAEQYYSLERGVQTQIQLYRKLQARAQNRCSRRDTN